MKKRNEKKVFEKTIMKEKKVRMYKRLMADDSTASDEKIDAILKDYISKDPARMIDLLTKARETP